jgi:hypothetical protein
MTCIALREIYTPTQREDFGYIIRARLCNREENGTRDHQFMPVHQIATKNGLQNALQYS